MKRELGINKYLSTQFGNPKGFVGMVITKLQNIVNAAMYSKAVSLINVSGNDKVLDIGYGNGYLLKLIYRKSHADMYGIDISDDAMAMAFRRNKEAINAGRLHLIIGDCCDLPYMNDTFSAVTSINTVYFWSDTLKGLKEIRRTLKNGCSFYNILYTKDFLDKVSYTKTGFKKFELEQLVELGKQAGYRNVKVKKFSNDKAFAVIYTK